MWGGREDWKGGCEGLPDEVWSASGNVSSFSLTTLTCDDERWGSMSVCEGEGGRRSSTSESPFCTAHMSSAMAQGSSFCICKVKL